jgi:ATP-dependent DNA helicase PIF1
MMLTVLKGPISYEDIKKVAGTQLNTFREACFAMGFLGDDKEFIGAIKEAKDWGSGQVLRYLFVSMLLSATMDRPGYVWKKTVQWLSDDILYTQRRIANNRGTYIYFIYTDIDYINYCNIIHLLINLCFNRVTTH